MKEIISFNKPLITPIDQQFYEDINKKSCSLSGDGKYSRSVHLWLENYTKCFKALLTHSCTAALEMSAILLNIKEGDEVIMPSYTFVSTANAVALRGGIPRFIDIREDTLNIDEKCIERAINKKTKAIFPVHYAGVACEMDFIQSLAKEYKLFVVEDAAQAIMSTYKKKPLGSIGDLGAFSFHETKNIISGEGGALIINNKEFNSRAEIIREKGTDRTNYKRGKVEKYSWCDIGSSYLPSELVAAFLLRQLNIGDQITKERLLIWNRYHLMLESLENHGFLKRPFVPKDCKHNGHIYYVLVDSNLRNLIVEKLFEENIQVATHYVPLHSSVAGLKYGRISGSLDKTNICAKSIIRLPIWNGLTEKDQEYIVEKMAKILRNLN